MPGCNNEGQRRDRPSVGSARPEQFAPERAADYYPPSKTGLRGDNPGSFDIAHQLKKAASWETLGSAADTTEQYDAIVVGAGMSGLAAAHFYRQRFGSTSRILVLESHDDVGGHATRNEFTVAGRLLLSYGGSQSISSPSTFSDVGKQLLRDLGIEVEVFEEAYDHTLYARLATGLFFDRETYGRDQLLTGLYRKPWKQLLAKAPLTDAVRNDIVRIYTEKADYLAGLSQTAKIALLKRTSYRDYLIKHCRLVPEATVFFQSFPHDLFAVGIDGVSAWSCYHGVDDFGAFVYPGFDGLGLPPLEPGEPYIHHFPDGNASVARLLVRALVPAALPCSSMHDVVLAKLDYSKLDQPNALVRIRLNSTVVHTRHVQRPHQRSQAKPDDTASPHGPVEVVYSRGGNLFRVTAKHCVLACYNAMIPYICPELPRAQRKALSYLVRMPMVYTHVALRNWKPFADLGIHQITAPSSYFNYVALDFPVSLGDYKCPRRPDEPAVLFMLRVPCRPGRSRRDQNRIGRWELLTTDLPAYERFVRDQLQRMLAGTGFEPDRDIEAITVNRWAHGYAFVPNRLFDPEWPEAERPWVVGRRRWGSISIANSDAGASAYLDVAVDQAWRAVQELEQA
jgi:spermidine dehydrogenase